MTHLILTSKQSTSQSHNSKCARLNPFPLPSDLPPRLLLCNPFSLKFYGSRKVDKMHITHPLLPVHTHWVSVQFTLRTHREIQMLMYIVHNFSHFSLWTAIIWQEVQGSFGVLCHVRNLVCLASSPFLIFAHSFLLFRKPFQCSTNNAGFGLLIYLILP